MWKASDLKLGEWGFEIAGTSVRFEDIVWTLAGQEEQEEVIADIEELEDDSWIVMLL